MFKHLPGIFLFSICLAIAGVSIAAGQSSSYARLLPDEKEIVDCNSKFDSKFDPESLASSYLVQRRKGPLDGIKVADKDKAELESLKKELLKSSSRHIFVSEIYCAGVLIPDPINGDAGVETVAKSLVDQDLADQIILDAKRYVPNEFSAAKSNEVRITRSQVERALIAFSARAKSGKFMGMAGVRMAYYLCRFEHSEKQCFAPITKRISAKYANH